MENDKMTGKVFESQSPIGDNKFRFRLLPYSGILKKFLFSANLCHIYCVNKFEFVLRILRDVAISGAVQKPRELRGKKFAADKIVNDVFAPPRNVEPGLPTLEERSSANNITGMQPSDKLPGLPRKDSSEITYRAKAVLNHQIRKGLWPMVQSFLMTSPKQADGLLPCLSMKMAVFGNRSISRLGRRRLETICWFFLQRKNRPEKIQGRSRHR